jgi:hypothetical protein
VGEPIAIEGFLQIHVKANLVTSGRSDNRAKTW